MPADDLGSEMMRNIIKKKAIVFNTFKCRWDRLIT
jgi:hypothetical protein